MLKEWNRKAWPIVSQERLYRAKRERSRWRPVNILLREFDWVILHIRRPQAISCPSAISLILPEAFAHWDQPSLLCDRSYPLVARTYGYFHALVRRSPCQWIKEDELLTAPKPKGKTPWAVIRSRGRISVYANLVSSITCSCVIFSCILSEVFRGLTPDWR